LNDLYIQEKYADAYWAACELLHHAREVVDPTNQQFALAYITGIQNEQGDMDLAERNLSEAITSVGRHLKALDLRALKMMVRVRQ
jgi:hypothetical protein